MFFLFRQQKARVTLFVHKRPHNRDLNIRTARRARWSATRQVAPLYPLLRALIAWPAPSARFFAFVVHFSLRPNVMLQRVWRARGPVLLVSVHSSVHDMSCRPTACQSLVKLRKNLMCCRTLALCCSRRAGRPSSSSQAVNTMNKSLNAVRVMCVR